MVASLGGDIGILIGWSLSGWLIETFGWQWAFYASACVGCVFSLVWYLVMADTPANHPRITAAERQYIESSLVGISKGKKV